MRYDAQDESAEREGFAIESQQKTRLQRPKRGSGFRGKKGPIGSDKKLKKVIFPKENPITTKLPPF